MAVAVGACASALVLHQSTAVSAASTLTIRNITWGVIGLDSNDVTAGPDTFEVGGRVCNTGDQTPTGLTVSFVWDTANANINLSGNSTVALGSLAAGACADAYFDAVITRTTAAYNTTRGYRLVVVLTGTGLSIVSTPTPRELFVEKLISQNRNSVDSVTGPTTVFVGQTYSYTTVGGTATGGYEQLDSFLNFPNAIFQLLSVATTYSAPSGATNDSIYADACGWDPVPTSPTYRSCIGPANYSGGKAGGQVITSVYTVRILSTGSATLTALINDFSGSSYHYNSDYGVGTNSLLVTAISPVPDLTVAKSHAGTFTRGDVGDHYTITVTNRGSAPTSGTVTVTDTLPAGLTATAITGSGWSCSLATLSCTRSDALAASASYPPITVTVDVASDAPASVTNGATVAGGGEVDTSNDSAADATTIAIPGQPPGGAPGPPETGAGTVSPPRLVIASSLLLAGSALLVVAAARRRTQQVVAQGTHEGS